MDIDRILGGHGWFGDLVSYSPDRAYAVRFYDAFQFNPPQSTTIGIMYRWEIVADADMMVQHQFVDAELKGFPSLFEKEIKVNLGNCHPYVMLTEEDQRADDVVARRHRFWYWSDDSRFFTIMLLIEESVNNMVVTFDMKHGQYLSSMIDHLTDSTELREIGSRHICRLCEANPNVYAEEKISEQGVVSAGALDNGAKKESKPGNDVCAVNDGGNAMGSNAQNVGRRKGWLYWICFPILIFFITWLVTYLFIGYKDDAGGIEWSSLRWPVSLGLAALFTVIGLLSEVVNHSTQKRRLREYRAMGYVVGKPLSEFTKVLGAPSALVPCTFTDRNDAPGRIAMWSGPGYQIAICFDEKDNCVSIKSEILPPEK